jgi:NAD(P)-dependent dehydrogenase (short-subunit alcohol dehydrogenase family)
LINNAGIYSASQESKGENASQARENLFDPPNATFDNWTDVYRTNVASHYFVTTAFLPLLARGSGPKYPGYQSCVINISSINGLIKTSLNHFASNAAKAATIHLTKMLAVEIAKMKLHIRVNSIAPGVFPSEITAGVPSVNGISSLDEESWPAVKEISSGRVGTHMDMAQAVLFVACCQYVNGVIIPVDGGYLVEHGTL